MAKNKGMTIEEVKKKKIELESTILKMVKEFEKETGLHVNYLSVDRDYGDATETRVPRAENEGKLVNVDVKVQFGELF